MAEQLIIQNSRPGAGHLKPNGFKAYEIDTSVNPVPSYNRCDFYKVSLITGHFVLQYADYSIELDGTYLFFANPRIPYTTLLLSVHVTGYASLFTNDFLQDTESFESLQQDPWFDRGGYAYRLTHEQAAYNTSIFHKMLAEQSTNYRFRDDLIRSYLQLLIHEGLRVQGVANQITPKGASPKALL